MPEVNRFEELKKDYIQMREMIYGEIPSFDDIIETLKDLEREINSCISC